MNTKSLNFSLSRFFIAFTLMAALIGYGSRFGSDATVCATISSLGLFTFVMLIRSTHLEFVLSVLPSMVIAFKVGCLWFLSDQRFHIYYPIPLTVIYGPLLTAVIGALFGFHFLRRPVQKILKSAECYNEYCKDMLSPNVFPAATPNADSNIEILTPPHELTKD